jgi:hypothetical protein
MERKWCTQCSRNDGLVVSTRLLWKVAGYDQHNACEERNEMMTGCIGGVTIVGRGLEDAGAQCG